MRPGVPEGSTGTELGSVFWVAGELVAGVVDAVATAVGGGAAGVGDADSDDAVGVATTGVDVQPTTTNIITK